MKKESTFKKFFRATGETFTEPKEKPENTMERKEEKVVKKEKPEPEKDKEGHRIITEKFCLKLCEYNGGYELSSIK